MNMMDTFSMMDNLSLICQMNNFYSQKLNIAIIGAGRAGYFHVQSLLRFSSFNLVYLVDTNLDKANNLQKIYGSCCQVTDDIDIMLADNSISAVIIATSTPTHYHLTIKCLSAGKHVLCEKPLENITECFKLAKEKNTHLLVAYHKRFDKSYQEIIKKIKMYGSQIEIKNIKMTLKDNFIPPLEYLQTSRGIVKDMLTHDIDIINLLMRFQIPSEIVAITHTEDKKLAAINEIEDIEVLMKYDCGTLVNITSSRKAGYGYDHRMEVAGSFGLLQLQNETETLITHSTIEGVLDSKIKYNFPERFKDAYLNELNYFYHMIVNNYPTLISPDSLKINNTICNLINMSIEKQKIIYPSTLNNSIEEEVKTSKSTLRNYEKNTPQYNFYVGQHKIQTLEYVEQKIAQYSKLDRMKMTMKQALSMLDDFIDPSDPDVDLPNSIHAYQTAERIRKARPLQEELQVVGLIHDLGKVLFKFGEDSHTVVGDTFALGCPFPKSIIFYETLEENPDFHNSQYQTGTGIYSAKCGLKNLKICFGHDEYLYLVLRHNPNHLLSEKFWNIIRFHSFYPWHTGKDYYEFMEENDKKILEDVIDFNQFDLYSKEDIDFKLTAEIKKYYENLLDKYFPEELSW
jgi:inositol oxygenase